MPVQKSYTSTPLSACNVQLNLYSPLFLYSTAITLLHSVPVQYSYTSLTSVPVQYSYTTTPLSAFRVQLYLYSPQCFYSIAKPLHPSVSVEYSYNSTPLSTFRVQLYLYSPQYLYSTAIPLLPSVPVQYSYTSTLPMGRTACTQPQCLYRLPFSFHQYSTFFGSSEPS